MLASEGQARDRANVGIRRGTRREFEVGMC